MNKQTLAAFAILLFALAITGYTYSHWTDKVNIHSTLDMGKLTICIQDYNLSLIHI